jgi:thiamine biosynthesis protein ThiS
MMISSQTAAIKITVNGETCEIPHDQTVRNVLDLLGIEAQRVAVELNRRIVPRSRWEATLVGRDSVLEIVHFVGGG